MFVAELWFCNNGRRCKRKLGDTRLSDGLCEPNLSQRRRCSNPFAQLLVSLRPTCPLSNAASPTGSDSAHACQSHHYPLHMCTNSSSSSFTFPFFLFVNSLKGLIFGFCFWFLFFYSEVEVYWSSPRWPSSKIRACRFAHTVNLCLFLCFLSCGYLCFEVWVLCIFLWYLGVTVWVFLTCRFWLMGIASSMWFLFSCWSIHVGGDQLIIWNYMLCLLVWIAWELIFFHYPCIVGKIKFVWGQTWKAHRLE